MKLNNRFYWVEKKKKSMLIVTKTNQKKLEKLVFAMMISETRRSAVFSTNYGFMGKMVFSLSKSHHLQQFPILIITSKTIVETTTKLPC